MMLTLCLAACLMNAPLQPQTTVVAGTVAVPLSSAQENPVQTGYAAAWKARDSEQLSALWKQYPDAILPTFDGDLEASLALWEKSEGEPDEAAQKQIAEHHERALWAAKVASDATGRPIFHDYASSFVGWNAEQKRNFRAGQAAFGRARKAMGDAKLEDSLAAATECRELALPLGDWWGTAMGMSGEASALRGLGRHSEAAAAYGQARLLYHDLGLYGSEYQNLRGLLDCCVELGARQRGLAALEAARALADRLGRSADGEALDKLQKQLAG